MRLKDRVAIVTGASRGIGSAIARGLAHEGASVVVNYAVNANAAAHVVEEIRMQGGTAVAVQCDVRDLSGHSRLVDAAEELGEPYILINNAGTSHRQSFLDATEIAWEETVGLNLKGVYFLTQAVARRMATRGCGKIVNISSLHDRKPAPGNSIYCISKSGLVMMTRVLAVELAGCGIQVNCVSPGAILTDENSPRLADAAYRARILDQIPARRIGSVEDCVGAVILLCSPESDYITGSSLSVDGGMGLT